MRRMSLVVASVLFSGAVYATDPAVDQEIDLLVKADDQLAAHGDQSLGDNVDLYTGAMTFRQVDVSLPGNSKLPVAVVRRFYPGTHPHGQEWLYYNDPDIGTRQFLDWSLEVPQINFPLPQGTAWPNTRCSTQWLPPRVTTVENGQIYGWDKSQYWQGYNVQLVGSTTMMLVPAAGAFQRPANFIWVGADNIGFSCTNTAKDLSGNSVGEGFVAWLPDGTSYTFDLLKTEPARSLTIPPDGEGTLGYSLQRTLNRMLVTRITDRFGNTVDYRYDASGNITDIVGSDNRSLHFSWTNGYISQAQDSAGRIWKYQYSTTELTTVVRPDQTQWTFSLAAIWDGGLAETGYTATGSLTSPYGLTGTFTLTGTDHPHANTLHGPLLNYYYTVGSLVQKQLSGPNMATQTWGYHWDNPPGFWAGYSGSETKMLTVTDPVGTQTKYTFNTDYDWREGALLEVDVIPSGSQVPIQTTTNTYEQAPLIGNTMQGYRNDYRDAHAQRLTSSTTVVNGDTYITQYQSYDGFNNPTQIDRSNNFSGNVRLETRTYVNNSSGSPWVIGALSGVSYNGTQVSQTGYDALVMPQSLYSFGRLTQTLGYNTDGTLGSSKDPINPPTSFSNYAAGIAQNTTLPDSNTMAKTVSAAGMVTSFTNATHDTTSFGYDSLNRLTQVAYPTGDTVNWDSRSITYSFLTVGELGMPAGTFRARSVVGSMQRSTYFDAELHPVLVEEKDTSTNIARYVATAYDFAGRVVFQSYPSNSSSPIAGTNNHYDALGRLDRTYLAADNTTLQSVSYQSHNSRVVTDGDGNQTTATYQAFDQPAYSDATLVQEPENKTTTIARNPFGEMTSVTASGVSGPITDYYAYDTYHRICKRTTPETGQSVTMYDAADEVTWSAKGQQGDPGSCGYSTVPSVAQTSFTYDKLKRVTAIDYPDASGNVTFVYDPNGRLLTNSNPTATWSYTWNRRGLIESETAAIDGMNFAFDPTYDPMGHVASLRYPDNQNVPYSPDAWGQPTQLGTYASAISYYPNGIASSYTLGNGLLAATTLDARQRLVRSDIKNGVTALQSLSYEYTIDGDLLTMVDNVDGTDSATMTYDGLHRLKTADGLWGTGTNAYEYSYDTADNITSRSAQSGIPTAALTYSYNSSNQLTSVSGAKSRTYGYDTEGRVQSDGTHTFSWVEADEITGINGVAAYSYDGHGKRMKAVMANGTTTYTLYSLSGAMLYMYAPANQSSTDYIYLAGKPLAEMATTPGTDAGNTANQAIATLVQKVSPKLPPQIVDAIGPISVTSNPTPATTVITYLHPDLLGSPRAATGTSGSLLWREHYDPYGVKMNGVAEKLGYTSHVYDPESTLTYMQARYYDADVGRFLSNDPMAFSGNPANFNRYAYVTDNPYRYTDPTGQYRGEGGYTNTIVTGAVDAGTLVAQLEMAHVSAPPQSSSMTGSTTPSGSTVGGSSQRVLGSATGGGAIEGMQGLNPKFAQKLDRVVKALEQDGWQPKIAEGLRTPAQQAQKVRQGFAPRGSDIPGSPLASRHMSGQAADVIDRRWGWDTVGGKSHPFWGALGQAAEDQGLRWGGDFNPNGFHGAGGDVAHVECPTGGC